MTKIYASSKGLLFNENRFLIIKEKVGEKEVWDLPGGKIEYGETPEKTLLREVREEVGIDAEIETLLGIWSFYTFKNKDQMVCILYRCKTKNVKVDFSKNPSDERFADYKWVTKKDFFDGNYMSHTDLRKIVGEL